MTSEKVLVPEVIDELEPEVLGQITKQLNFYFSDSNYPKDNFLLEEAKKNDEGWIAVAEFCKFNKIKALTSDVGVISKCFKNCEDVTVSEDGNQVKRKNPIPSMDVLNARTIVVAGFSKNVDKVKIDEFFSQFGKILSIWFNKAKKGKRSLSIEFENEEIAKATASKGTVTFKEGDADITLTMTLKNDIVEVENKNENKKNKKRKHESNGSEITPGLLMRITNIDDIKNDEEDNIQFRDFLKAAFAEYGKVQYVDEKHEGGGYILRFSEAVHVQNAIKSLRDEKNKLEIRI